MELKSYGHILRNKLLFRWTPFVRPAVYRFYSVSPAPVFVLGNQKSGTSVIAALLAKATGLSYDIDLGGLRVPEYAAIYQERKTLPDVIRQRAKIEFSKGLVKEPNLTFLAPELRSLYPRSRFVFIVRDPRDNIRSMLNRLNIPGNLPTLDPDAYPELSPMWRAILYNEWVGDPRRNLNYVGRSAERWRMAVETYLAGGPEMVLIRYEDFRKDKLGAIADLARRLALPVRKDISASLDVQYQVAGRRTDDYARFYGHDNLSFIEEECAELMRKLAY